MQPGVTLQAAGQQEDTQAGLILSPSSGWVEVKTRKTLIVAHNSEIRVKWRWVRVDVFLPEQIIKTSKQLS